MNRTLSTFKKQTLFIFQTIDTFPGMVYIMSGAVDIIIVGIFFVVFYFRHELIVKTEDELDEFKIRIEDDQEKTIVDECPPTPTKDEHIS